MTKSAFDLSQEALAYASNSLPIEELDARLQLEDTLSGATLVSYL
jgi:hypothetical protein